MADGEALMKVGDSVSVSSPSEDCSSPILGESPHKPISDCSDLYDLINFHSSATTQIHQQQNEDDDDEEEEQSDELQQQQQQDDILITSTTTTTTTKTITIESNQVLHIKRNHSVSSSSSDDHDSDSGNFSKTNGHAEIETTEVSVPDNEEVLQISDITEHKSLEMELNTNQLDDEERDELNEFSNLEAEIEKEEAAEEEKEVVEVGEKESLSPVEKMEMVDSVVAPELHDINPDSNDLVVLSHHELSSPVQETADIEEIKVESSSPVLLEREEILQEEAAAATALEYIQELDEEKHVESESSSSSEEEEEEEAHQDEECVTDTIDDCCEEQVLPPVIVDVEISHEQKLIDNNTNLVEYPDSDHAESREIEKEEEKSSLVEEEDDEEGQKDDNNLHVEPSISSDSDSDSGKYGYQKKKKIDQYEKTSTTSSTSSAVITTMVTKKSTAEMKIEQTASTPKALEMDTGNSNMKSSFNTTENETRYKEFNEVEGVKIDRNKITRNFSQSNIGDEKALICRICGKQVFHMESIKAEKSVFHKTCFRCKECSKSLSVDTYCSHEGVLYCRQHFRQLFQPKAKFDEEIIVIPRRRHELIIKENTPTELPPDVVRSADKPDYGLNEIPSLKNVKSRFEERGHENGHGSPTVVHVKRSESIASKMAKFQNRESSENGHHVDDDSSSSEEDEVDHDPSVLRETKHKREKVVFSGMSQLKTQWESGSSPNKEERAREKQEELAKLRLRICHGKGNLKAKYENAVEESQKSPGRTETVEFEASEIHTSSLKEKFEKGNVANELNYEKVEKLLKEKEDDLSVFKEQAGTAVDARSIFRQIDANASKNGGVIHSNSSSNVKRSPSMVSREVMSESRTSVANGADIVKSSDKVDDDFYNAVDLTSRFKFFENYKDEQNGVGEKKRFTMTPPREIVKEDTPERDVVRDPNIVRCCDREEDVIVTDTARKMLSKFRELENQTEEAPAGPKPLKRITPPREFTKDTESPEPELVRDPNIIRACDKVEDDFIVEAHRARSLKEKFEHWEGESEVDRENRRNADECQPSLDTAKSLTAKFESLRDEQSRSSEKPPAKVNRFI